MKNSPLLKLLSLLLCLLLVPVLPAMAAGSVEEPEYELIDPTALDEMVDDYLSSHGEHRLRVSGDRRHLVSQSGLLDVRRKHL